MMLYREHRGSLDESMETVKEVDSEEQLRLLITNRWKQWMGDIESIKYSEPFLDKRVNWNTSYVSVKFTEGNDFVTVGMINGKF